MSIHHRSIAIFIDFENLALGLKGQARFEIKPVIKRLLEKGKIVAKRAYCDWSRFGQYTASLHEAAIELIEIPKRGQTGKNSADIRLCVDAMDLAYSKDHIDTFVIVSGDSDFSPLVSKLKELGKHVIGLGMTDSTSNLLRDNCDEFIYYEDLVTPISDIAPSSNDDIREKKRKAFAFLFEGLQALRRDNRDVLMSPLIKITIKRLHPAFDENQFGYRNWSSLLLDAQKEGLIELSTDIRSRSLIVLRFGDELKQPAVLSTNEAAQVTTNLDPTKIAPPQKLSASMDIPAEKPADKADEPTGSKVAAKGQPRTRSPVVRRKPPVKAK